MSNSTSESTDPYSSTPLDTMLSSEQERLNTFTRWPDDVPDYPVSARSLAQAGFYVNIESNPMQTRCFSCGLAIGTWCEGDVPMERHRESRPDCGFVREQNELIRDRSDRAEEVDNRVTRVREVEEDGVQLIRDPEGLAEDVPRELYQFEEVRLQSFHRWPIPDIVSAGALARAGFYSLNPSAASSSDSVQCAFCEGAVGSWERGDCPDREHRRHFPLCPFVVATINPRLERLEGRTEAGVVGEGRGLNVRVVNGEGMGNLQELGVHTHTAPRKPRFTSLAARLASFSGWPPHLVQTPAVLAAAGFYYEQPAAPAGTGAGPGGDHVRCFHCDGGLKHWDPHDDPWTEHARWFPHCSYVLLVKGAEFVVGATQHGAGNEPRTPRQSTTTTASSTLPSISAIPSSSSHSHVVISDRELQSHLQAPPALEALSLGIVVERVKQAIKDKLERTGTGFSNGAALIEAALNLQRDEDLDARLASGEDRTEAGDAGVNDAFFQMLKDALDESIPVESQREDVEDTAEPTRSLPTATARRKGSAGHNMTVLNSDKFKSVACIEKSSEPVSSEDRASSSSSVKLSLEEENRLLKEARLCKICMDSEVGIVFLPCGHLATCVQCAPNLQACPVCRSSIRATVRTFLS